MNKKIYIISHRSARTRAAKKLDRKLLTGFSIIELVIAVGILSVILVAVLSLVFWMQYYGTKGKADKEVLENGRRVLDSITYEIREATSVYTPTTTASQLSLETTHYLPQEPQDETKTYIDFFLCGTSICIKKESQNPVAMHPDSIEATSLQFTQVANGLFPSIKIDLAMQYKNPNADSGNVSTVTLSSTVALRKY